MSSRTLTPANQITILRLVFVPLFAILVIDGHYVGSLVVLMAAAVSDGVDGLVARVFHQQTPLGVALDPIADKLLMITAYVTLAARGALPWWLTVLVLSRDAGIIITALLVNLILGYRPFRPSLLGKASTVVQVMTVFVALAFLIHIPPFTGSVVRAAVYLAAALTVASGLHYLVALRYRYFRTASEGTEFESSTPERRS